MTEEVTIFKCAHCGRPFSYVPSDEDKCPPGTPNQICDDCLKLLTEDEDHEGE